MFPELPEYFTMFYGGGGGRGDLFRNIKEKATKPTQCTNKYLEARVIVNKLSMLNIKTHVINKEVAR